MVGMTEVPRPRLVQHHGTAVDEEAAEHITAGPEQLGQIQPEEFGDGDVDNDDADLEDTGDQGGQCGAPHAHGGDP